MRNILFKKSIRFLSLFLFVPLWLGAQNIIVTGKVTDKSGEALVGVSVTEKGTSTGTASDADGNYSLSVSRDATLNFNYVGYAPQSVSVQGKNQINVTLEEDTKALGEVVVIGYGTQRKEAVTGSVASIGGNAMRDVPAGDITNALQGRVAGVQMSQTSTKPGSTMQIRIRGTRSINADNDPLIVLDGIPFAGMNIGDISPNDIKSIDILKDASATAIYGSRGANGVIIVTTYSGNKNQQAQLNYSGYFGWKTAIKYPMMNATDYAALRARANLNPTPGLDEPVNADGSYTSNTDWQDLFFRTGIVTNHDLSVTGGTEQSSYKFGVGFYDDQAVIPDQWYKRYSLRGSLDQKIGILRLGFTTNNNFNITNGASIGIYGVLSKTPVADAYNADGSIKTRISMPQDQNTYVYSRSIINALGDQFADITNAFGSYNSLYAELSIPGVEGLKARVNLGGNYRQSSGGTYRGIGVMNDTPTAPNSATITNILSYSWTDENLITYDRTFNEKHQISVVAMYSAEQDFYNKSAISRKNIAADNIQFYNLGQSLTGDPNDISIDPAQTDYPSNHPNGQDYWVSGLESVMGRIMYSFDNRYMISATVRSDGSSRLAPGHQWHTYPAISAGWNINKESFMQNVSWIDALKLRLGWGQTSNQSVPPYSTLGQLSVLPANFGSSPFMGYYVTQLPNPNLGWEYSITTNVGLDFTLLKNRLSGTFEYYSTNTNNLLLSVNMPSSTGVSSYMANVGSTSNKGWELTLNGTIIKTRDWQWDAGVNFTGNRNRITALASGATEDKTNWLFVGHPINVIYDWKKLGIWQESEADQVKLDVGPAGVPGMIKVQYTGSTPADGGQNVIGDNDKQVLDADPNWTGGFSTRVAYKGFDLNLIGTFQNGGILNSTLYGPNSTLNWEDGRRGQLQIDYWTPDNPNGKFPDPAVNVRSQSAPLYSSTLAYFSGTYLKLGTATLGYNFDPKMQWIKKTGIQKLRVYFTVQNPLILFSPYHSQSGMDPETNSYGYDTGNQATLNGATGSYLNRMLVVGYNTPCTHNYMLGLNITF